MSDEYDRDDHREDALALIEDVIDEFPEDKERDVAEATYTFSELSLFEDGIEIKGSSLAIQIWALVEKCRRGGWDDELRM